MPFVGVNRQKFKKYYRNRLGVNTRMRRGFDVFCWVEVEMISELYRENQIRQGVGDFQIFRKLGVFRRGNDYAGRNVSDLGTQSTSAHEEATAETK